MEKEQHIIYIIFNIYMLFLFFHAENNSKRKHFSKKTQEKKVV